MAEYLTVKEFARKYGKDPGNIRLMLLNGAIKGEKLGSQWIIPKDTPYPPDRRIKSGDYRNWRKKLSVARNSPELMNVLTEMCSRMERIYGDMLEKVILYGSYARGEQTEDSDVEIAVFLNSEETAEMHSSMLDIVVDCELDAGVTLSVITLETDEFLGMESDAAILRRYRQGGHNHLEGSAEGLSLYGYETCLEDPE